MNMPGPASGAAFDEEGEIAEVLPERFGLDLSAIRAPDALHSTANYRQRGRYLPAGPVVPRGHSPLARKRPRIDCSFCSSISASRLMRRIGEVDA
jgi:hypothetical protein